MTNWSCQGLANIAQQAAASWLHNAIMHDAGNESGSLTWTAFPAAQEWQICRSTALLEAQMIGYALKVSLSDLHPLTKSESS